MLEYINKLLRFIKGLYESNQPQSSKRFFGSIGFLSAIVFIALWRRDLVDALMYTSAALLGLETVTSLFKK